jgi:hypothetical protein
MKPRLRANRVQAARSPSPGGRHECGRATQDPCKIRLSAAPAQSPVRFPLAGDTEPLFSGGFSEVCQIPVLRTASRFWAAVPSDAQAVSATTGSVFGRRAPCACRQLEKEG